MDSDDLEVPQELYDSEINFSIACFWDGGFDVGLGVAPRFDEKTTVRTYREACRWLKEVVLRHYRVGVRQKTSRAGEGNHDAAAHKGGRSVNVTEGNGYKSGYSRKI